MAIQGFFTGDVKIRDLNGVLKAVDGIVEVATDAGTVTSVGLSVGSTGTDVNVANSPVTTSGNITLNLPTASATNRGLLSSVDWGTFNSKQNALGYTAANAATTLTINGTTYDLSANRSWSVGTHTGSLNSGYIPKATGTTTLVDGLLYDTGSAVLLGTQTAGSGKFMVYSTTADNHYQAIGTAPSLRFADTIVSPSYTGIIGLATATNHFIIGAAAGDMVLANNTTSSIGNFLFGTGATERMRISPTGNVSIGGTGNTYKLDVTGTGRFSGQLRLESTITNGTYTYTLPGATGTLALTSDIPVVTGYVPYTGATGPVNLGAYDLLVQTLTIGKGNSSLANNTALGYRTLFHITTGNYNTAVGYESSHNTTTGQYNTSLGQSALFTNTTGSQNTAIGLNALLLNTTGGSNVVVGLDALQHNTTGSSNTALGYNAGSHITGGSTPNTTASSSVYIGRDTKAKVDGGANEIVIGYNAIGNGSNTATFGNTSTTANYFTGSINGGSFVKSGGTSSQFLKADGSVDSSTYYLASNPSAFIALTSLSATAPLSYSNTTGVFSISQATTSTDGYLSSTDWNTFNGKQAAGSYITALTGEATASGPGSATVTLSTSAVTGKLLTGLNLTGGGTIAATDSILQAFGKVQNQISGMVGGVTFQGTWDASTNTPTLTSSVGTKGYYYIVSVAGSTNLNGITDWKIGDWAIFNGTTWDKVDNTDAVSSVNGFTGAVSLTTSNIAEGTNLYYLDSRARLALSFTAGSGAYDNTTGVITIPTNTSQLTNGANFITLSSLSASSPLAYNSGTGAFSIQVANGSQNGYLSSTDWTTFNSKQAALTLTTTGSSGSSTLVGATLNVPTYTLSGLGGVPTSRQLTINGTAYDLSADRSWSVGTVTSVGLSSATSGVTIGSTPVTTSGTITLAIATASGSQQGLLSSTDWTTFNNKQSALTNPVTGTGTTNYLPKFTGTSTIGNSVIQEASSNIGIGGSPSTKLHSFGTIRSSNAGNTINTELQSDGVYSTATDLYLLAPSTKSIYFYTNNSQKMLLDSSGNLGLGVTPSAWGTAGDVPTAFQFGASGMLYSYKNTSSSGSHSIFGANAYFDGSGFKYINTNSATYYRQYEGTHAWLNAPSGTAGNAISFTQAMTLLANGNLGLGTTSPSGASGLTLALNGGANQTRIALKNNVTGDAAGDGFQIILDPSSAAVTLEQRENSSLSFTTNNTERLTIASTGAATFSSSVKATQFQLSAASGQYYYFDNASGNNFLGLTATNTLGLYVGGNLSLSIASTGAATFSSSVTAGGDVTSRTSLNAYTLSNVEPYVFLARNSGSNGIGVIRTLDGGALAFDNGATGASQSTKMTITSGGNVGIGTTSPNNIFTIYAASSAIYTQWIQSGTGTTSTDGLRIGLDASSNGIIDLNEGTALITKVDGSERMRITSGGNVGIGTTSPAAILQTQQTSAGSEVTGLLIQNVGSSASTAVSLNFAPHENASSPTTLAKISAVRTALNNAPTDLVFHTFNSTLQERMRITSGGNVGIGTTSPAYKLDVVNAGANAIRVQNTDSSADAYFIAQNTTGTSFFGTNNIGPYIYTASALAMQFYTNNAERMRITSGGTLLVGTTTEGFLGKLQVAGSVAITGQYNTVLPSSSFSYFDGSGQVVSSSSSASALYLDTTWNTTGNPDGIYLNVTNTASGASSKLLNLKVGSVSQFSVSKAGAIQTSAPTGGTARPWKLGTVYTGTCVPSDFGSFGSWFTGTVIEIEVNGTTYKIPAIIDNYC